MLRESIIAIVPLAMSTTCKKQWDISVRWQFFVLKWFILSTLFVLARITPGILTIQEYPDLTWYDARATYPKTPVVVRSELTREN